MKYEIFPPSKELEHIVKNYVVISSLENIDKVLFLPNGGNFIVFNRGIKADAKVFNSEEIYNIPKDYSVSIKTNKVKKIILDKEYKHNNALFPIILVELLPIGFYKLFNMDSSLINSGYLEIDEKIVSKYFLELYSHEAIQDEIKYLDASLNELNLLQNNSNLCIEDVISKIAYDYHYEVSVEKLLEEFACSRSTMERQFKRMIGLTPKNFIFISKFSNTMLSYINDGHTFKELQYLYSDNSHMNVVFQKFLGISPSEIFKQVANEEVFIYQINNIAIKNNRIS